MNTRALTLNKADAWAIHDCLQGALAGFGGRHETAEPWHATALMDKLRPLLVQLEEPGATHVGAELTEGELKCIDLNVPRTAYQGATALLLRVYLALKELSYHLSLSGEEPNSEGIKSRLAAWRNRERESPSSL